MNNKTPSATEPAKKPQLFGHYTVEELREIHSNGLSGRWRHSQGLLCTGTARVARADFDSSPSEKVQANIFEQLCASVNALPHLLDELERLQAENAALRAPLQPNNATEVVIDAVLSRSPEQAAHSMEVLHELMEVGRVAAFPGLHGRQPL